MCISKHRLAYAHTLYISVPYVHISHKRHACTNIYTQTHTYPSTEDLSPKYRACAQADSLYVEPIALYLSVSSRGSTLDSFHETEGLQAPLWKVEGMVTVESVVRQWPWKGKISNIIHSLFESKKSKSIHFLPDLASVWSSIIQEWSHKIHLAWHVILAVIVLALSLYHWPIYYINFDAEPRHSKSTVAFVWALFAKLASLNTWRIRSRGIPDNPMLIYSCSFPL